MPDRLFVAEEPYEGMFFLYNRADKDWVLRIDTVSEFGEVSYSFKEGVSSMDEANDSAVPWFKSYLYTRESWKDFVLHEDEYTADSIRVLDRNVRTPDWEV